MIGRMIARLPCRRIEATACIAMAGARVCHAIGEKAITIKTT